VLAQNCLLVVKPGCVHFGENMARESERTPNVCFLLNHRHTAQEKRSAIKEHCAGNNMATLTGVCEGETGHRERAGAVEAIKMRAALHPGKS
jgi:hypothetical protein